MTPPTVLDPVEDERHIIFDCPEYTHVREQFPDIFSSSAVPVGHFSNQPDCNRVAQSPTHVRMIIGPYALDADELAFLHGNGSLPGPEHVCTYRLSISHHHHLGTSTTCRHCWSAGHLKHLHDDAIVEPSVIACQTEQPHHNAISKTSDKLKALLRGVLLPEKAGTGMLRWLEPLCQALLCATHY